MSKRLSANERARILSNHEKGIEDPNYYVLKTKTGVLNIRRKKVKFDEPASSEESSKEEASKESSKEEKKEEPKKKVEEEPPKKPKNDKVKSL